MRNFFLLLFMMADPGATDGSPQPEAAAICGWLKKNGKELLAGVLEDLLLQDIGAESLIDGSVGKILRQFDPKNLTAEELFGKELSDAKLENSEKARADAITKQLSAKADELKGALIESVAGGTSPIPGMAKPGQGDAGKKGDDACWDFLKSASKDGGKPKPDVSAPDQNKTAVGGNVFDVDEKVRKDVVCDGIFKKFRDKMRGTDLPKDAERPVDQLYNLYDHYYDALLTREEVNQKRRFSELCRDIGELTKQLAALCGN